MTDSCPHHLADIELRLPPPPSDTRPLGHPALTELAQQTHKIVRNKRWLFQIISCWVVYDVAKTNLNTT